MPVNFSAISSGLPLSQLPRDPVGTGDPTFFYSYIANPSKTTFKLAAKIESKLYGYGGDRDTVSNDGGISTTTFETGTALDL